MEFDVKEKVNKFTKKLIYENWLKYIKTLFYSLTIKVKISYLESWNKDGWNIFNKIYKAFKIYFLIDLL